MKKFFNSILILTGSLLLMSVPALAMDSTELPEKLNVKKGTVASGVHIYSVALDGLTEEAALQKVKTETKKALEKELTFGDSQSAFAGTLKEMGFEIVESEGASELKDYILRGSLIRRYKFAKDLAKKPAYLTGGIDLTEEKVLKFLNDKCADWNCDKADATAYVRDGELKLVPHKDKKEYHFEEGAKLFVESVLSEKFSERDFHVEVPSDTEEADFTYDKIKNFSIIGTFTTHYDRPTTTLLANRQQNLMTSTSHFAGRRFAPGEVISALNLYGEVSIANGYAVAGTYNNGAHTDEVGGGICQTTTTLYNAVMLAELEIVYRHNHSSLVTYIPPAMDAMVYAAGGSDFKFKNTSSDYIILDAYVNPDDTSITISIIGHEDHPSTHSVRYESEIISLTPPSVTYIMDPTLPIGYTSQNKTVLQNNSLLCGCSARCWKITTDNGVETRTLFTNTDNYRPMADTLRYSPDLDVKITADGKLSDGFTLVNIEWIIEDPSDPSMKLAATSPANPCGGDNLSPENVAWRLEFNQKMQEALDKKYPGAGYQWTAKGSEFVFGDEVLIPDTSGQGPAPEPRDD